MDEAAQSKIAETISKQIIISQLSNSITYSDTNDMDVYELEFVYEKLCQMKKEENEAKIKALDEAKKNLKK